ncbi:MAG: hypothetical protein Q8Q39_04250 [bacterium]|nr:hypothetical protein [bacterium]
MGLSRPRRSFLFSANSPKAKKVERNVRRCAEEIAKIRARQPEMLVAYMLQGSVIDQQGVALVERYYDAQLRMRQAVRRLIEVRQKAPGAN